MRMVSHRSSLQSFLIVLSTLVLLSACNSKTSTQAPVSPTDIAPTIESTATTIPTPTPTPVPSAALVNGSVIPLTYFENEVRRYKGSFGEGETMPGDAEINTTVLDYLIDQELLAQAANQSGYEFTEVDLETRISDLVEQLGSGSALTTWMEINFYSDEEFRYALKRATEAAWQRDKVISSVPDAVEQVRARQIFALTREGAEKALGRLKAGADFDTIAWEYSPESGGELGWFPKGYLLFPQIEEMAFSLPEGEYSEIIETDIGFHILMVMEHEESHILTTDAKVSLQSRVLSSWLEEQRTLSTIEINLQ